MPGSAATRMEPDSKLSRKKTEQQKPWSWSARERHTKGQLRCSKVQPDKEKETGHLSQRFLQDTVLVFPLNTDNIRQKKAHHSSSHVRLLCPDHFLSPSLLTCPFHLLLSLVRATPHLFSTFIPRGTVFSLNTSLLFVSQPLNQILFYLRGSGA